MVNLSIEWPPSVILVTSALSGNVLDLDFVRPEWPPQGVNLTHTYPCLTTLATPPPTEPRRCLFQTVDISPYYAYMIGTCGIVLAIFSLLLLARLVVVYLVAPCMQPDRASRAIDTVNRICIRRISMCHGNSSHK